MATIIVDGTEIEADESRNLLEVLLACGEDLPYFCWHPKMGSVGACRQCAVVQHRNQEDERGRIVMSCMTPITEGAIFSVQNETASEFRASVVENLMINHPHDCPVCEEGGECHLQDMTVMTGHRDRSYRHLKMTFENQYLGPFIGHEMNRCITCYRCVRYYQDYAGGNDLAAFASRDRVYFGRVEDGVLENEFAGNLVEVCPTGVFTDKTLSEHYTRKWDLASAPAICTGCSLGCNISVSERYGELRRIHNRYHGEINGYFLCDRGRFGGQFVNSEDRIPRCGQRNSDQKFEPRSTDDAVNDISTLIKDAGRIIGIGSARASLESNYALRQLVGEQNYFSGLDDIEAETANLHLRALHSNLGIASMTEVEDCDAIIILGEDVTNHAPRLALSLRQSSHNAARSLAHDAGIPLWHDAAVRGLAQDKKSPVFILTPYADRLDDVSTAAIRLSPREIADTGFALANAIAAPDDTDSENLLVDQMKTALMSARKPLIVSGSSLKNVEIVKASLNVAVALKKINPETRLVLAGDECNTLAVATLATQHMPSPGESADLMIVVENDLQRHCSPEAFFDLLANVSHLVTIDHSDSQTVSASHYLLPAATFAESEGTYINNEGRAQRSYGAFKPKGEIAPSWIWLMRLAAACDKPSCDAIDDLLHECADAIPGLAGIVDAAPDATFRGHGLKVNRMTHQYSGRTAMRADINVHEPQQPGDEQSALTYSMEGINQSAPPSMKAYTWAPGWNSNQSISKFQDEIGGHLSSGDPGKLLFSVDTPLKPFLPASTSGKAMDLVPGHHIFTSDEMSSRSSAIRDAAPAPYAMLNAKTASNLDVDQGDGLKCQSGNHHITFQVAIDHNVADDCAVCLLNGDTAPLFLTTAVLTRDQDWTAPDTANLIGSDRMSR